MGQNDKPKLDESDGAKLMSIGALARKAGVSVRTIRYYEELGILPAPPRSEGGTRRYPPDYAFYLEGALALKDVGFTLDELKLVGRLALGNPLSKTQQAKAAKVISEKMSGLDHKIRVLNRLHDVLAEGERRARGSDTSVERLERILGEAAPSRG